ncbi:ATP-binding protein [Acutalibacter muris]|jgi:anti-sigma regulatory factor (Ser/Thr protein kinase)|uniref:ATP-binding protein n=1 Tax=Acutalibacter muris TaxID=1796620 RepID=UPI001C3F1035|nr:ATP-binding protein [Acutalibacter muris]MCI9543493.1 ATP-binding protein [Acutalibacter muris]
MRELSLNVMDIAQNSISAGASLITITVEEDAELDELSISIGDNGRGMTPEQVEHVTDPFFTTRTTRSVGLGVPLFKMEAEMTGGRFSIESTLGVGTTTTAVFKPSSVDMIPLGDINGTVSMLVMMNPDLDFLYTRSYKPMEGERREFALDTRELRTVLGEDVPLNLPDVTGWVNEFLSENTDELLNGSQNQEGATDI